MNTQIMSAVSGGKEYDTVYAAGFDQNSAVATTNVSKRSPCHQRCVFSH